MAHWFKTLFAETGTKTAVPDATDPSGYVSYNQGYGADYQRVLGTDPLAKAIERDKLNQVLYDMTGAIQQYQTHGFPDYIDATTNGGTPYAYVLNAIVRWTDGKNYRNTVAANTSDPSVSGWVLYNDSSDSTHAAATKAVLVDADEIAIADSAATFGLKKITALIMKTFIGTGLTMTGAITRIAETKVAMGANDFNLASGNVFTKTFTATTFTMTVSNALAAGNANSFIFETTNAGLATITWMTGTKWAGGVAPTLTSAGVDILGFYSHDGGTTWRGMVLAKDSK